MKKRFAMFLSVCLLLSIAAPGFAAPEAPAATSQTQALIEKIEAADAFTINYAFSLDGVKITVFYPVDGVSAMQKRQMQTTCSLRAILQAATWHSALPRDLSQRADPHRTSFSCSARGPT